MKFIDQRHLFNPDSISLYAVDRSKRLTDNRCALRNIERVATFILYRSGREIGRIVEYPEVSLEQDLQRILTTGK